MKTPITALALLLSLCVRAASPTDQSPKPSSASPSLVGRAETPPPAAVQSFFTNPDPFIQRTVIPNIETNRTSACTLQFVDAQGAALPNLQITGRLKQHQFLFGACPPESKADLDPRFIAAWSNLFNYGVAQNAMKWANVEQQQGQYDFSRIDQMVELCSKCGIALEYHFLTGYHPSWLAALPIEQRAKCQKAFARAVLERYQDKIAFFQVYNEDWLTHVARAAVYFDQTEFFAELTREFPHVRFGVSDCWSLDGSSPLPDPEALKKRYPGISYIAMHAHRPRRLWPSPEQMYQNFDKYLGSGVKIHLTEYGIDSGTIQGTFRQGTWTEETKAECFVQVHTVAFSHPAVEAINHWDMGPGIRSRTYNAMLNADFSPKPAYEALRELIQHKLSTTIAGRSDAEGQFHFRGFHGQYEITVENETGRRSSGTLILNPDHTLSRLLVAGEELRTVNY